MLSWALAYQRKVTAEAYKGAPYAREKMDMIGGCCVCLDERGWDENPLVYCDGNGCNVAVHQACYGIVKVPSGPWFCCKCRSTERVARVKCELCPFKEGALKRTDNGGWAHVVCALYIPEVRFGNVTTMEPIKMSSVPHERFLKTCYICEEAGRDSRTSNGACMSCNKPGCKLNFHVTCAQARRMLCEEAGHFGNVQYVGYCSQHWAKKVSKFGSKTHASEHDKKQKEKKQNKAEHISSSDSSKVKKKEKIHNLSKAISNSTAERTSEKSEKNSGHEKKNEPLLARAGSAEKSAAESLNLLQQMPGLLEYFPNEAEPKTPLNSLMPENDGTASANSFNVADILSKEQEKKSQISSSKEEVIDVVNTSKVSNSSSRGVEKGKEAQKSNEKHKGLVSTGDKSVASGERMTSQTKKVPSSQLKASGPSKSLSSEGKKRKSLSSIDGEKRPKKKKIEEKRKVKKNVQKSKELSLPRPSQVDLLENDRIPSLFPRNFSEKNPESFQDLLEFQWNQGARFCMQKATHYDVGSLLSCLYQLRAENDDLQKRLEKLSARRDRLIAATTRLSTPLSSTANAEKKVPLSSMLAKLRSEPNDSSSSENVRPVSNDTTNGTALSTSEFNVSSSEGVNLCSTENSTNSTEDLDCKEVLSEGNSQSGTPPKEVKKNRDSKRGSKVDHKERENGLPLQSALVQPPMVQPSDSCVIGSITASHMAQSPVDFIHRIVRQHRPEQPQSGQTAEEFSANLLDFIKGQTSIVSNIKPNDEAVCDGKNASSR